MKALLRTTLCSAVVALAVMSLTGCGVPITLNQTITIIDGIDIPEIPEIPDEIPEDFPAEWLQYIEDYEDFRFDYSVEEEFCDLPDLQRIRDEAASEIPTFLANRLQVREINVENIRFIATQGSFDSVFELEAILTLDNREYRLQASNVAGLGTVVTLIPTPPLNIADLVNNGYDGCIKTWLNIQGTLPEELLDFKVEMALNIKLYLRIL